MAYDGKVTIWIQKEDREKWDAIQDKPKWLHEHLNPEPLTLGMEMEAETEMKASKIWVSEPTVTPPEEVA